MKKTPRRRRERQPPAGYLARQDRDIEIIKAMYRYRFLTSHQIKYVIRGSNQKIHDRCIKLYDREYIDLLKIRLFPDKPRNSEPYVWMVDNAGAALVERAKKPAVNWRKKNKDLTDRSNIEHELLASESMIRFEVSCRNTSVRFIPQEDLLLASPSDRFTRNTPVSWRVHADYLKQSIELGVNPDHFFGLHYTDLPDGANKRYFFLEADRATESIFSSDYKRSSVYKHMVGYLATFNTTILVKSDRRRRERLYCAAGGYIMR